MTDERGMFADKRARRVGDILTVVCKEDKVDVISKNKFDDLRTNESTNAGLGTGFLNQLIGGITSEAFKQNAEGTRGFPGNLLPRGTPRADYTGKPGEFKFGNINETNQTQTLTLKEASIAVQVIDVLPNGNLVLEGIREVAMPDYRGRIYLRGLVRALDLNAINAVSSAQVADLRLAFLPEGANVQTHRKGWLQKIDEKITPW